MNKKEKAVVTVVGKNSVGIMAKVATVCADNKANIVDVSQSVKDVFFTMIMLIDVTDIDCSIEELENRFKQNLPSMQIHVMHEDIFNAMHTI